MTTSMSCSWCHASNIIKPVGETYCVNCGHRADVCRLDCTCVRCQPFSPTADDDDRADTDEPTPLADPDGECD